MLTLHHGNDNQVASGRHIDADLGVGGRRLLVVSGIAMPSWKVDTDDLQQDDVCVRLGIFARNIEQWTVHVGLASISNDETEYVFATDTARVELDPQSGEMLLFVHLALMGEWSFLGRFGYQVVATIVRVTARISGTITWSKTLFTPASEDVSLVAPHLIVTANRYEEIPPSDLVPFGGTLLTPIAPGQIISVDIGPEQCVAEYRVDNPPMAMPLQVSLKTGSAFHSTSGSIVSGQSNPPFHFTLTGAAPAMDNIDFSVGVLYIG